MAVVLVLSLAAVLGLVGAGSASLAAVAVARQRAASAADLAALAAAERALDGQQAACQRASSVARLAGAHLRTCSLAGDVADILAEVRPHGWLGRLGVAAARARAGPAAPTPGASLRSASAPTKTGRRGVGCARGS